MDKYLIVYYGEICLKGDNRHIFENRLIQNIKSVIKYNLDQSIKVIEKGYGYSVLHVDEPEIAISLLKYIPGISNILIGYGVDKIEHSKGCVDMIVSDWKKDSSFKVHTKRHNKNYPMKSNEINAYIGDMVDDAFDVKLKNPDNVINVAVTNDSVYIGNEITAIGGMPVGVSGNALCLLSGGMDSPVASYLMMKRGMKITFVHFQNKTIMKHAVQDKIEKLVKQLARYQVGARLIIVPFADIQKKIISFVDPKYRMLMYRRYMFKLADLIASKEKIKTLVTGDNLAQVASQTESNLISIYNVVPRDKLILSPLIGYNKVDVIKLSRELGLYDISKQPYEDCCSLLIAKRPATKSSIRELNKFDSQLNISDEELDKIISKSENIDF